MECIALAAAADRNHSNKSCQHISSGSNSSSKKCMALVVAAGHNHNNDFSPSRNNSSIHSSNSGNKQYRVLVAAVDHNHSNRSYLYRSNSNSNHNEGLHVVD